MEKWAFATSLPPFGLGMSSVEFWFLSHEEYDAKVCMWERHQETQGIVIANLRSDLHNGQMERRDKRAWTPQDFGAPEPPRKAIKRKLPREQTLTKLRMAFTGQLKGPDGKKISALESMPPGQPLPRR